jgi:hypothetical protein
MKLITLFAVLACACGGGKKSGNPEMAKEAEDLAKRYCECSDDKCAEAVKTSGGKDAFAYFMDRNVDVTVMSESEQATWRDARFKWNDCARPGYFKNKAKKK